MKQKYKLSRFPGMLLLAACISLSMGTLAWSDNDDEHEGSNKWKNATGIAMISNKAYKTECSACHFAYQPGFLPQRSWVKIMGTLDDHFGENAELDEATRQNIEQFLSNHAADRLPNRFSRSFLRSVKKSATPLRISEAAYFIRRHHEVPSHMVKKNPKVRSFSNCASCHTGAEKGSFSENEILISGFGHWED